MKNIISVTSNELKEIAASIVEIATMLESNNYKGVQIVKAKKKEFKGKKSINLDVHLKFRVFTREDIDEINKYLKSEVEKAGDILERFK